MKHAGGFTCAPNPLRANVGAGERPLDDSKRLCAHLLEKAIDQLDDDCETLLGIFDLRGFGTQNADFGFVRFLVPQQTSLTLATCPHE